MAQDNDMGLDRLIADGSEKTVSTRDKYEIVTSGEEADLVGSEGSLTRVPTANPSHHGGSHGFNHLKGVSITADCNGQKFTIPNLVGLPKEAQQLISQELAALSLDAQNEGADFGKAIAKAFKKHLAAEYKGDLLPPLKTWVNGDRDPFKNPVSLPESKIVSLVKSKAVGRPSQQNPKGASAKMSQHPHLTPDQVAAYSSFQPNEVGATVRSPAAAMRRPVVAPPVARAREAVLPAPSKLVVFKSTAGVMRVKYHSVLTVEGEPILNENNQFVTPQYLVLSKNLKAEGSEDYFTPSTPIPGTVTTVTLADNSVYELGYVMMKFRIGTVEHIILCVSEVREDAPVEDPQANDPMYGEPVSEFVTEEDAVAGLSEG